VNFQHLPRRRRARWQTSGGTRSPDLRSRDSPRPIAAFNRLPRGSGTRRSRARAEENDSHSPHEILAKRCCPTNRLRVESRGYATLRMSGVVRIMSTREITSMSSHRIPRRTLLKNALLGVAAVPAVGWRSGGRGCRAWPGDPQAALGKSGTPAGRRQGKSGKPGQTVPTAGTGNKQLLPCNIFPGKQVRQGWCKVWVKRPEAPYP
jgi:hypothetical protein